MSMRLNMHLVRIERACLQSTCCIMMSLLLKRFQQFVSSPGLAHFGQRLWLAAFFLEGVWCTSRVSGAPSHFPRFQSLGRRRRGQKKYIQSQQTEQNRKGPGRNRSFPVFAWRGKARSNVLSYSSAPTRRLLRRFNFGACFMKKNLTPSSRRA